MKLSKNEIFTKLFDFNPSTYYRWKDEKRPIIGLIEEYFSLQDLHEFLETGRVSKLDLTNERENVFYYAGFEYLDLFLQKSHLVSIGDIINSKFMDLFFNVLVYAKNDIANQSVFKPFTMGKTALLYLSKNSIDYTSTANSLTPSFEVGIEMLDEFNCYINDFVQTNILQNFAPMIKIANYAKADLNQKVEAYLHAILFNLYNEHQDKSAEKKREIFTDIFAILFQAEKVKYDYTLLALNAPTMSLDTLMKINIKVVEKNYDKIIQAIKTYQ